MSSYLKELEKYRDIDEDEILKTLSPEELEQLDCELQEMDPENLLLPAGLRQRDQTKKSPTGPLDRDALLQYLEQQALEVKERDDLVPFTGEKKGKPYIQPKREIPAQEQITLEPELEEALANATDAEMCDIAAILGMYTLMSNKQYYDAICSGEICNTEGISSVVQPDKYKPVPDEPPNPTNIEEILKSVRSNDKDLEEVNLNNIKDIPIPMLTELCEAMKTNTHVRSFSLVATRSGDPIANAVADMLRENRSLQSLNIESNFISSTGLMAVLKAVRENATLTELPILGMYTLMSNKQYYDAICSGEICNTEGISSVVQPDKYKPVPDEPPNPTNIEEILKSVRSNDKDLEEVNLNNIKDIPIPMLTELCEAMKTNTHVRSFSLVATRSGDPIANAVADMLRENRSLQSLNIESNFISSTGLMAVLKAVRENATLTELRVDNQRQWPGDAVEMEMATVLEQCPSIVRFGYHFTQQGPRARAAQAVTRNNELRRQQKKR
ncbi:Tropomodulin-4 [Myotis brandtii]|uniref:Tropomodulin-4 n=1 Tax=Myotis brandtii TaxID=109478 RepID=S7NJ74_MYOBR|nr:Tropomodulin-4 [Myotis brandtii]